MTDGKHPRVPERAKRLLANARVTASIAANVVSPVAAPLAARIDSGPPLSPTELTQRVQEDLPKDWARYELLRKERVAGDAPQALTRARRERDRGR